MDIEFRCPRPECGAAIGVRAALAGKKVRCPSCHQAVGVPAASPTPAPPPAAPPSPPPAPEPPGPIDLESSEIRLEAVRELMQKQRRTAPGVAPYLGLAAMVGFGVLLFIEVTVEPRIPFLLAYVIGLATGTATTVGAIESRLLKRAVVLMLSGWLMLQAASAGFRGDDVFGATLSGLDPEARRQIAEWKRELLATQGVGGLALRITAAAALGAAFSLMLGAAMAVAGGRWGRGTRLCLGASAGWLVLHAALMTTVVLADAGSRSSMFSFSGIAGLFQISWAVLFVALCLLAIAAALASLRDRVPRGLARAVTIVVPLAFVALLVVLTVWEVEMAGWAIPKTKLADFVAQGVSWLLVFMGTGVAALGVRDAMLAEK